MENQNLQSLKNYPGTLVLCRSLLHFVNFLYNDVFDNGVEYLVIKPNPFEENSINFYIYNYDEDAVLRNAVITINMDIAARIQSNWQDVTPQELTRLITTKGTQKRELLEALKISTEMVGVLQGIQEWIPCERIIVKYTPRRLVLYMLEENPKTKKMSAWFMCPDNIFSLPGQTKAELVKLDIYGEWIKKESSRYLRGEVDSPELNKPIKQVTLEADDYFAKNPIKVTYIESEPKPDPDMFDIDDQWGDDDDEVDFSELSEEIDQSKVDLNLSSSVDDYEDIDSGWGDLDWEN